jgi:hypothetical protein
MTFWFDSESIESAGSTSAIPNPQELGLSAVYTPLSNLLTYVSRSSSKEPGSFRSVQLICNGSGLVRTTL